MHEGPSALQHRHHCPHCHRVTIDSNRDVVTCSNPACGKLIETPPQATMLLSKAAFGSLVEESQR